MTKRNFHTIRHSEKEGGDIGLYITLVPKVLKAVNFLVLWLHLSPYQWIKIMWILWQGNCCRQGGSWYFPDRRNILLGYARISNKIHVFYIHLFFRVLLQIAESINEEGETEESETPEDIKTKAKEKEKSKGQSKKDKSKEKEKDKDKDKEKAGSKDSKEKDKEKSGKEKDNKTEKETSPKKKSFSDKDKSDKGSKLDKFRYKHKTPSAPPLKQ